MTPAQLQAIADSLQSFDVAKATYTARNNEETIIGGVRRCDKDKSMWFAFSEQQITHAEGDLHILLTYLEKLPKPIRDEPPVGFGAFNGEYLYQKLMVEEDEERKWLKISGSWATWTSLYLNVTRVYDLDGDIVEWDYSEKEWRKR